MNRKSPADQAARDRIRTELTRSMLVEAGAGSGKTHEMATRMAAGIASGVYEIEHMAAVTFTRKAAAEMRGRFQLALEQELAGTDDDPAREARLHEALGRIERFFAGTIHAFCARLLRERPVEARVSPDFGELDDADEMMVRRQSWRDYRAQAKAAGDPNLLALLDAGIEPKQLESAFDVMCNFEDVEFPGGDVAEPDGRKAWQELERFWTTLETMLPPHDPATKCTLQQRAERFAREWRFASRNARDGAGLAKLLQLWSGQAAVTQNRWPQKNGLAAKQLHADFRESVVQPHITAWRQYVYRLTVTLLDNARTVAREDRRRQNSLIFNDLLIITAELLRTNESVRRSLQQKYRWLFVDEFQDTDPIQAEIMFWLAEKPDARDDRCLFVVGDPKQSIYRFRRADIDIYNDVRARLAGPDGAGLIKLTTNFRSVPALCSWANGVFKPLFPKDPTPQSPMFAPLDPHRDAADGPALATITLSGDRDAKDTEAEAIARYIRAEVDAKRRKFGDFLILTRKKKALQPYARALERVRVPIEVTGAGAFGESEEVRHLALLLEALADPQDAVALVGVLRGSLFGLSDRELFAFRQAGGYFGLFSEVATTDQAATRVTAALSQLRTWYSCLRVLPAGAALERILDDSGLLALAATSPDGVEAGDLLHAIDRVRAIVERGFTLADAAEALAGWSGLDEEGAEESNDVDSLPLEPGRPDVVRLMNLHKAKGLEAKVVFLADPKGGFTSTADVRIVRTPGGGAQGYFRIEKDTRNYSTTVLAEPAGWERFAADEQAYLDAEVHRLMYVAATRAQDLLVIGRVAGAVGPRAAWPAFDAHLAGAPELAVPATVTLPDGAAIDMSAKAFSDATSAAERAHAAARTPSWTTVSVTAESKAFPRITPGGEVSAGVDSGDSVTGADALPDPTRVVTADTPSRRADAGVEWGTLVHGLLEHAMRHKTATRADLRRLAMWLTMEKVQLRAVIEQALDTVEAVAHGDFWPTARASSEAHAEVPFSVCDDRAGIPAVQNGTIDLVYRADDTSWRILDYKTDVDADAAELQQRYATQLEMYRRAWERFGGSAAATVVSTRHR